MEKELVEFVVKNLVDKPDAVNVNVLEGDKNTVLELSVAEEDIGKVIGKQGRIAKALRTLIAASSSKSGRHVSLDILD